MPGLLGVILLTSPVLLGIAVGFACALRRYGGIITFIASVGTCCLLFLVVGFSPVGCLVLAGGPGICFVIVSMFVCIAVWAHQLRGRRKM